MGMNGFEQRKLNEIILYLLNVTGGMDYYHIFKILYFAEREHLAKWGHRMIADDFCALEYGPVPTHLYDAIKVLDSKGTALAEILYEDMRLAGVDAPNVLIPQRMADLRYISKSELEALDNSLKENSLLTFKQLMIKSHDSAWQDAYNKKKSGKISILKMAEAVNADDMIIKYITEQLDLENVLI